MIIQLNNLNLNIISFCQDGIGLKIKIRNTNFGYIIENHIRNVSHKNIEFKGVKYQIKGIDFGKDTKNNYFFTNENARIFGRLTIPIDRNIDIDTTYADPDVANGKINQSPYQPFPAVLFSNYETKIGIEIGSLSQDYFYHCFDAENRNGVLLVTMYSLFKLTNYRILKTNEKLVDKFYIGYTDTADNVNSLFQGYSNELRKILKHSRARKNINRHTLIWDSWNDGIYRNISEDMLINEAKAIKKHFPNVEWFQLDDGYSSLCNTNVDLDAHGIGTIYEENYGIDLLKFPNGLKHYTKKIKKLGLKPSIWVGNLCPINSQLYKDHPDLFLDYSYRINFSQPFDVSNKKARNYLSQAIKTFVKKFGFQGLKIDFWSYPFEDSKSLYKNKEKSGYEYRTWWQKEIIKHLPKHSYVQTGCDIGLGNPFIGKYFNNYRYAIDVGAGKWSNVKIVLFWSVATLLTHCGDLFIPNSDSMGLLPELNDIDFIFVVNFQIITRTLVEISGKFSTVSDNNKRLSIIKKATKYINNGENVFFAKYDYRNSGKLLPEIIYIKSAFDSPDKKYYTVALFNSDETTKTIFFSTKDLGLDGEKEFINIWNKQKFVAKDLSLILQPHESLLFKIKI